MFKVLAKDGAAKYGRFETVHGTIETVSYTHLDVYKRQACISAYRDVVQELNILQLHHGEIFTHAINLLETKIFLWEM